MRRRDGPEGPDEGRLSTGLGVGLFGDPEVLPVKVFWDYTYYWGVLTTPYFHGGVTDLLALDVLRDEIGALQPLNVAVQDFVRQMSAHSARRNAPILLDQPSLPWLVELNRSLLDEPGTLPFKQRLQGSARRLRPLTIEILDRAAQQYPRLDGATLQAAIERAGGMIRLGEPLLFAPLPQQDAPA